MEREDLVNDLDLVRNGETLFAIGSENRILAGFDALQEKARAEVKRLGDMVTKDAKLNGKFLEDVRVGACLCEYPVIPKGRCPVHGDLFAALLKEGEAFRSGEKALLAVMKKADEAERLLRISCEIACGEHVEDTTLEGLRKGRSPELADMSLAIESACARLRRERDLVREGSAEFEEECNTLRYRVKALEDDASKLAREIGTMQQHKIKLREERDRVNERLQEALQLYDEEWGMVVRVHDFSRKEAFASKCDHLRAAWEMAKGSENPNPCCPIAKFFTPFPYAKGGILSKDHPPAIVGDEPVFPYILKADRDKPPEEQTVFYLRNLPPGELKARVIEASEYNRALETLYQELDTLADLDSWKKCKRCGGFGAEPEHPDCGDGSGENACPDCSGHGIVPGDYRALGKGAKFIEHIKAHLKEGDKVLCKICDMTLEEIADAGEVQEVPEPPRDGS